MRKYAKGTPAERFWFYVDKSSDCWTWQAYRNPRGYGTFGVTPNNIVLAHRFAWELTYGPIPPKQCVLHRCDNPACVNPAHLFVGDRAVNNADMRAKERHAHGDRAPQTKLSAADVTAIRTQYAAGDDAAVIAARYGLNRGYVYQILSRRARRDVRDTVTVPRRGLVHGWSRSHPRCIECGTTERKHNAHGLCLDCYQRQRA